MLEEKLTREQSENESIEALRNRISKLQEEVERSEKTILGNSNSGYLPALREELETAKKELANLEKLETPSDFKIAA